MRTMKRKRTINARLVVSQLLIEERLLWEHYSEVSSKETSSAIDIEMAKWKWWAIKAFLKRLNIDESANTKTR